MGLTEKDFKNWLMSQKNVVNLSTFDIVTLWHSEQAEEIKRLKGENLEVGQISHQYRNEAERLKADNERLTKFETLTKQVLIGLNGRCDELLSSYLDMIHVSEVKQAVVGILSNEPKKEE